MGMAAGLVFQVRCNQWDPVRALYFVFYVINTAGLEAPGTVSDVEMWFLGFWCLVGVPIVAQAAGVVADYLTLQWYGAQRLHATLDFYHQNSAHSTVSLG